MAESGNRTESRRDRQRRELVAEIVEIARAQLASGGRAAVSWRGIAREVGMNPASLYTYFDGLDDLFTAVILDSYGGLAAALGTLLLLGVLALYWLYNRIVGIDNMKLG